MMLNLLLLLIYNLLSLCVAEVFHVTPTLPATQDCPSPCHTLDQYAQNTSLFEGHTNTSTVSIKCVPNSYLLEILLLFAISYIYLLLAKLISISESDAVYTLMKLQLVFLKHFNLIVKTYKEPRVRTISLMS